MGLTNGMVGLGGHRLNLNHGIKQWDENNDVIKPRGDVIKQWDYVINQLGMMSLTNWG